MPLGAITGIADGLGSVVMNAVSGIQRRRERNQAHRHHEDAMAVAKRNYEFSREQHAYQQYSNVRQHQREDTQIQRTMADARAAGIHPVAALGMGGQAGVPSNAVNAPSGVGASGSIAAGAKGDMGMLDAYLDIQRFRDDLRNSSAQRKLIGAKEDRERAETDRIRGVDYDQRRQDVLESISRVGVNDAQRRFLTGQTELLVHTTDNLVANTRLQGYQASQIAVETALKLFQYNYTRHIGRPAGGSQAEIIRNEIVYFERFIQSNPGQVLDGLTSGANAAQNLWNRFQEWRQNNNTSSDREPRRNPPGNVQSGRGRYQ